jgi:hypothetical protein
MKTTWRKKQRGEADPKSLDSDGCLQLSIGLCYLLIPYTSKQ